MNGIILTRTDGERIAIDRDNVTGVGNSKAWISDAGDVHPSNTVVFLRVPFVTSRGPCVALGVREPFDAVCAALGFEAIAALEPSE